MDSVRFGIIGCGNVTEVKSGPALQKAEGSELVVVMRRDREKAADYARRHGVQAYTDNYLDVLQNPGVDAVYVATPPETHAFYTIEAARHGKAVYVEKPMATTVEEAKGMLAACREHGVPLFVAYYRRGQPKFLKAKELLESGAIGQVMSFHYLFATPPLTPDPARPWLMDRQKSGGGLLYDVGSHMVDTALMLLGEPREVVGRSANLGKRYDVNDVTSALFVLQRGVQGTMQFSMHAAESVDRLTVFGSTGTLSLGIMNQEPLDLLTGGKRETVAFEQLAHVQQPYIQ
ncbi:MAG TPA: Gfo/Idh/MocA family oxidoreductase, partial [Candidatus Limnocylindria bacterium]|nr:Gfo/Idh/MocA family oxidoreductase [Candidatus Limnocylindria bacterium]